MPDLDQIFVNLKHWLLGQLEGVLSQPWLDIVSILLSLIPILAVVPALFAIMTIMERKGLGRIQNRYGPNRVGPFGLLQPAADGIKALIKEDVVPRAADKRARRLEQLSTSESMPETAPAAAPAAVGESRVAESVAAAPKPPYRRDSKSWLAEIDRLRASGETQRADAELAEYKREHRAYAGAPDR